MRIMALVFVLAAFVLAAMRSMAQLDPCLLPLAERPDYCTGNAPTVTPAPTAAAQPPPEISSYPGPVPGESPGPAPLPYPISDGSIIFTSFLKDKIPSWKNILPMCKVNTQKGRFWICLEPVLHEKLTR